MSSFAIACSRPLRRLLNLVVVAALAACTSPDGATLDRGSIQQAARPTAADYVVVLKAGDPEAIAGSVGAQPQHVYRHALSGFAATLTPQAVAALNRNPNVDFIEADYVVHAIAQSVPTGVNRMERDKSPSFGTGLVTDVDVAVIDSGVDPTHPDLTVFRRTDCARKGPLNRTCADGTGTDGNGHGTHVAGTIGAKDDGQGVVGVAPGARIWAVRVLDNQGSGYMSWVVAGIDWVAARASEIEVANMSLGGPGSDDGDCGNTVNDAEHRAICGAVAKGIVFVVAAGNESSDASGSTPAAYDEVITVSALADLDGTAGGTGTANCRVDPEEDDSLAFFSNFGADVDLMAPGYCITSTWPGGGLNTISGTSMASPHVAGLAAAYLARTGVKPTTKSGALAVRDALIADAIAQNDPCGLVTHDDPDGIAEPIAFANGTLLGGDGSCDGLPTPCTSNAECDDSNPCNGAESCHAGACVAGLATECSDGDVCNGTETCDEATGSCVAGAPLACDDNNACNGLESCNAASGCVAGTPVSCDDGDACTAETCNPADGSCGSTTVVCNDGNVCTSEVCDSLVGCVATPTTGSCNDGNACTSGDACNAGVCTGTPSCVCAPSGATCLANGDCCSGRCRGKVCR